MKTMKCVILFKNGASRQLWILFSVFSDIDTFLQQWNVKMIHLVSGAGIQTHDLSGALFKVRYLCFSCLFSCNYVCGDIFKEIWQTSASYFIYFHLYVRGT